MNVKKILALMLPLLCARLSMSAAMPGESVIVSPEVRVRELERVVSDQDKEIRGCMKTIIEQGNHIKMLLRELLKVSGKN